MRLRVCTFLLLLASSSVLGARSSELHSYARRSFSTKSDLVNRQALGGLGDGLGGLVGNTGGILDGNGGDKKPDGPNKPDGGNTDHSPSKPDPNTSIDSPSPPSPKSPDVAPTPTPHDSGILGGLGGVVNSLAGNAGGVLPGGGDSPTTSAFTPSTTLLDPVLTTPKPTPTPNGGGGILGPILGPVTSAVLNPSTGILGPVLDPVTSAVLDPSSGVLGPVLDPVTSAVLDPSSGILAPVTSAILDPSSGVLGPVLDPVTSAVLNPSSGILAPITSAVLDPSSGVLGPVLDPVTSAVLNPSSGILAPITSAVLDSSSGILAPVTSVINPVTSAVIGTLTSVLDPTSGIIGSVTSDVLSAPTSIISSIIGSATNGIPIDTPTISSITTYPPTDTPGSTSQLPSPTIVVSQTTSAPPTISFPTPTGNDTITTDPNDSQGSSTTVTSTAVTTISIEPGLSFVLTESSLAYTSVPTQAVPTLTDPDSAPETASAFPAEAATTLLTPAPLPTGIPARIFPRDQLDLNSKDLSGYTLISILFNNDLNWPFVVQSPLASSQIFAYAPVLITAALNIPSDQVKTYALQVYIPTTYRSPADALELGTTYLAYIPSDLVDTLAAEIKTRTSTFYMGVPEGVPRDLANRVVSGYSLLSVADPNADPGTTGPTVNGHSASGDGDGSKSRQDAIIGVVSALGAIALLVLVFLVYRSMKRRKQTRHHRLSDPPDDGSIGIRPRGGQFDQDSVGGARRRSFYYAEDSLRGYEGQTTEQLMQDASPTTMSQRRNIVPASISQPVLKGSTMIW